MTSRFLYRIAVSGLIGLFATCSLVPETPRPAAPSLPLLDFDGHSPAARQTLQQAHDLASARPDDAEAAGRLGMQLHAYQRLTAALACYRRAGALDTKVLPWIYYQATVEARLGAAAEAVKSFRKALEIDPSYLPARLGLAQALRDNGEAAQARAAYEQVLAAHPDSAKALYGLGRALADLGKPDAAIERYEQACNAFPAYGAAHYALALAYRDLGKAEGSEHHLALYSEHRETSPPIDDPLLRAVQALGGAFELVRQGVAHSNAGRLALAAKAFEKALQIEPNEPAAHANLIIVYGRMGRFGDAEAHYRTAVALDPKAEDAEFNYGILAATHQKYAQAAKAFEKVLELSPQHTEALMNLGYLHERNGRLKEAEQCYLAVIEHEPGHAGANFRLGRLVLQRGDSGQAIERFQACLGVDNEFSLQVLYGLATAYAFAGDPRRALRFAEQAKQRALAEGNAEMVELISRDAQLWARRPPQ